MTMLRLLTFSILLSLALCNDDKIIACYYRWNQPAVEELNVTLCTHILLIGEAQVDNNGAFQPPSDEIASKLRFIKLNNKNVKVLLSLVSPNPHFTRLVSTFETIGNFTSVTKEYLKSFDLDGIDIDWEFPSWSSDARKDDKQRLNYLLKSLREAYGRELALTMAVSGPPTISRKAYDARALSVEYCDFVSVMNYDFHVFSYWHPMVGLNAPLYKMSRGEVGLAGQMNSHASMLVWRAMGLRPDKTLFGIPTYNYGFMLLNYWINAPYSPAVGTNDNYGNQADVCLLTKQNPNKYHYVWQKATSSPYIWGTDKLWLSIEDDESVGAKALYAKEHGVGGVMIYHIGSDDTTGKCGRGKYPLINSIRDAFLS